MALRESETTTSVTWGGGGGWGLRSATREVAPRSMASWAKEWPSTTVPTMQKNISFGRTSSLRNASPATSSFPLPMMVQSIPWKSSEQVLVITVSFL